MKEQLLHEINRYNDEAFPVGIYTVTREKIVPEGRGYQDLHWHEELQFTVVESGEMRIRVNGIDYELKKGEGIFINRNLLHVTTGLSPNGKYISLNFPDKILGFFAGSRMEQDYVLPYSRNYGFPTMILQTAIDWQNDILQKLWEVIQILTAEKKGGMEYKISICLVQIWYIFVSHAQGNIKIPSKGDIHRQERIRKMISFIHENYMQDICLEKIAASANVSSGECCRCFKAVIHQSPAQYLLHYRISKGKELLANTELSVTEIAFAIGFTDASHFIQYFKKKTNMTPKEYRRTVGD